MTTNVPAETNALRLGTRGSLLARTQSGLVGQLVAQATGGKVTEVIVRTEGDDTTKPIAGTARPGVFVSALRDALLANQVDFIVHSFKDLPSLPFEGVVLAAVPKREDPRDVLVSRSGLGLMQLPPGARVGTSSPRRAARILHFRPDLKVEPIRGNIDTRLAKVKSGEYEATILAAAGLNRVGMIGEVTEYLDSNLLLPAPAQGALAIECRSTDTHLIEMLATLNHEVSMLVTTAERAVLVGVNASCTTAIGAHAHWDKGILTVTTELSDGETDRHERVIHSSKIAGSHDFTHAHQIGLQAAAMLMQTQLGLHLAANEIKSENV